MDILAKHLVKHSWKTMGHPYSKLKDLDTLQVHFLAKMSIGLDTLYYRYNITLQTEVRDLKLAKI